MRLHPSNPVPVHTGVQSRERSGRQFGVDPVPADAEDSPKKPWGNPLGECGESCASFAALPRREDWPWFDHSVIPAHVCFILGSMPPRYRAQPVAHRQYHQVAVTARQWQPAPSAAQAGEQSPHRIALESPRVS